jgi:hypothetical protein
MLQSNNLESYEPYDEKLIVHLVHHTHDDVGWLKSKKDYFAGTGTGYHKNRNVHLILEAVLEALIKDSKRKFSYVEMSYFSTWYNALDDDKKT